jgi:DNA-binding CsgD family transcriptional regulator
MYWKSRNEEDMESSLDRARAFRATGVLEEEDDSFERSDDAWSSRADLLMQLPALERSIVELCRQGMSPVAISERLGMTWQGVAWRMDRLRRRIEVLSKLPNWTAEDIHVRLTEAGIPEPDAGIVAAWWETSSQSKSARQFGMSQGVARKRIVKTNKRLVELARVEERFQALARALSLFFQEGRNIRDGWLGPPSRIPVAG